MGQGVVSARASTPQTRRAFLAGALGLAAGLFVPAVMADAATRSRKSTPTRTTQVSRRSRKRLARGKAAGKPRRQAQKSRGGRQMSAERPVARLRDDGLLARSLDPSSRSLSLYHLHTGERITVDYFVNGQYEADCLRELNWVLRDHRTDEVCAIDPGALDLLYAIRSQLDSDEDVHIVCGYRSPLTNLIKLLSGAGVAERSYHLSGRAIDFFVPRRSLHAVRETAIAMGGGGVGYYPRSGFIHVDTGPIRYW